MLFLCDNLGVNCCSFQDFVLKFTGDIKFYVSVVGYYCLYVGILVLIDLSCSRENFLCGFV